MKIRFLSGLLFLAVSIFSASESRAQGVASLFVDSIPGFPVIPQDTAYEGMVYAYDIIVVNNTNTFINNSLNIQMRVDTVITTISNVLQPAIGPNDTVTISVTGYNFSQPQFKQGNNIVVVWPVVNGVILPVDSLFLNVYFVPLSSLGNNDVNANTSLLYPVPAHDRIFIRNIFNSKVEHVRIYATSGQKVSEIDEQALNGIDISFLANGIYFIEAIINNQPYRQKFVKSPR